MFPEHYGTRHNLELALNLLGCKSFNIDVDTGFGGPTMLIFVEDERYDAVVAHFEAEEKKIPIGWGMIVIAWDSKRKKKVV